MINGKKILAIVPARGGSVSLPKKNIKIIDGIPMIGHAIKKAGSIKDIDRLIVSTDSNEIAAIAKEYGAEVPFLRDKELAGGDTPMIDVIVDAVKKAEELLGVFDYAVMLQANSPLTRQADICAVIEKIVKNDLDVVFTVTEVTHPPQWSLKVNNDQVDFAFFKDNGKNIERRQQEETIYRTTGAVFAVKIKYLLKNYSTARLCLPALNQKTGVVITDIYSAIDIDNQLDFYLAESVFRLKKDSGQ